MSLLSDSELAAVQFVAESGMIQSATILRRARVTTDDGQETDWHQIATGIPCWIHEITPQTGILGALAGVVSISEVFSVRVPAGTDCHSGDQVIVLGQTYQVEHTSDESTYVAWLELSCRKAT